MKTERKRLVPRIEALLRECDLLEAHRDSKVRAVDVSANSSEFFWSVAEYEDRWDLITQQLDG